ncbi:MAG: Bax inhibitor-1 family protein, partial [Bacteroidota bacterium]
MNTAVSQLPVSAIDADARASFVLRTYIHLFGAILLFVAIEAYIFTSGLAEPIATTLLNMPGGWLVVLGGFVVVSWIASRVAATASSSFAQYAALGGFVLAEAIIFVPLLFMAAYYSGDPGMINKAAWVTLMGFTGLTAIAVLTRKDFSFLGGLLRWGFIVAIVLIVAGVL